MGTPQRKVPLSSHNCEPQVPDQEVLKAGMLAPHLDHTSPELFLACEKLPKVFVVLHRFDWYLARDNLIIGHDIVWNCFKEVESGGDVEWVISQHYHLRRGVHSRSLRVPQVDPSPVFAKPPLSSVVIQSVPPFPTLPSACAGSLKAPQDRTSLPKGDIFLRSRLEQLWMSGGELLVESWQGLDTFQFVKGEGSGDWRASLWTEKVKTEKLVRPLWAQRGFRRGLSINKVSPAKISTWSQLSFLPHTCSFSGHSNGITTGLYTSLWARDSKTLRRGGCLFQERDQIFILKSASLICHRRMRLLQALHYFWWNYLTLQNLFVNEVSNRFRTWEEGWTTKF